MLPKRFGFVLPNNLQNNFFVYKIQFNLSAFRFIFILNHSHWQSSKHLMNLSLFNVQCAVCSVHASVINSCVAAVVCVGSNTLVKMFFVVFCVFRTRFLLLFLWPQKRIHQRCELVIVHAHLSRFCQYGRVRVRSRNAFIFEWNVMR